MIARASALAVLVAVALASASSAQAARGPIAAHTASGRGATVDAYVGFARVSRATRYRYRVTTHPRRLVRVRYNGRRKAAVVRRAPVVRVYRCPRGRPCALRITARVWVKGGPRRGRRLPKARITIEVWKAG